MKREIIWLATTFLACCSFAEAHEPAKAVPRIRFIISAGNTSSPGANKTYRVWFLLSQNEIGFSKNQPFLYRELWILKPLEVE